MNIICDKHNPSQKPCLFYIREGTCRRPDKFLCIEYVRRKQPMLSYSSISLYMRCRYAYYLAYILGLQLKKPTFNKELGSLFHLYFANMHEENEIKADLYRGQIKQARARLIDEYNKDKEDGEKEDTPTDLLRIDATLEAYKQTTDIPKPKGSTEIGLSIKSDDLYLRGFIDLGVEKITTRDIIKIWDWKYTGNPDFYTHFTTRTQAGIYFLLVPTAQAITYRTIQKPAFKKGKKEPDEDYKDRMIRAITAQAKKYFQDKTFYRSEYDLPYIKNYIRNISNEIKGYIDSDSTFFFQEDSGCWCYGDWCDYMQICSSKVINRELYMKKELGENGYRIDENK